MARNVFNFRERDLRRAIRAFTKEGLPVQRGRIDRNGVELLSRRIRSNAAA
jgi:hypothetical protein